MRIKIKQIGQIFKQSMKDRTGGVWYISRGEGQYGYLHKDLKWYQYTDNKEGLYGGWYKSRQEARATLAAWYEKVTKLED